MSACASRTRRCRRALRPPAFAWYAAVPAPEVESFLGLGGNLGDVATTLEAALCELTADGAVRLVRASSAYRTPPWGLTEQPDFINRCALVATTLGPRELLQRALQVEQAFGRVRDRMSRFGPRPLDIDLLTYGKLVIDEPGLVLPHPRLFERAFVLVPLAEIAPGREIAGRRIEDALAAVDAAEIVRL